MTYFTNHACAIRIPLRLPAVQDTGMPFREKK